MLLKKPSETQRKALQRMIAGDGTVWRVQGGFWISSNKVLSYIQHTKPYPLNVELNDIWCDVRTVRAMEKAGWIERTNTFPDEWKDTRRITQTGREALGK